MEGGSKGPLPRCPPRTVPCVTMVTMRQQRALRGFLEIAIGPILGLGDLDFLSFQERSGAFSHPCASLERHFINRFVT